MQSVKTFPEETKLKDLTYSQMPKKDDFFVVVVVLFLCQYNLLASSEMSTGSPLKVYSSREVHSKT